MNKIFSFRNVTIFLLVIIVALSSILFITNKNLSETKKEIADRNISDWSDLHWFTQNVEKNIEILGVEKMALYHNAVIHNLAYNLRPRYAINQAELSRFLTIHYDPLFQDIYNGKIPEQYKQEALTVYLKVNKDLMELCDFVVVYFQENPDERVDLLENDNDTSKMLSEKISTFIDTNNKVISDFYNKF